jgi:hypothetical protein
VTADLIVLAVAFAFMAGGLSHLAIAIKRIAEHWFSEALDGIAREVR